MPNKVNHYLDTRARIAEINYQHSFFIVKEAPIRNE